MKRQLFNQKMALIIAWTEDNAKILSLHYRNCLIKILSMVLYICIACQQTNALWNMYHFLNSYSSASSFTAFLMFHGTIHGMLASFFMASFMAISMALHRH